MNETSSADIGSVLRQARLRRGQSLEVVHQQTRIPKKLLEALEANRFEEFPAVVYLRGFLKGYCDHLDVEFEGLWSQIDPSRPKPSAESGAPAPAPAKSPTPAPAPAGPKPHADAHARPAKPHAPAPAQPHGEHAGGEGDGSQAWFPAALLGAVVLGAAVVWFLGRGKADAPPPVPAPQPPSAIAPLQAPKEMTLRLIARKDTWMQLHTDGVLRFQGRAPAGFVQEWKAMEAFTLRTKDPTALTVSRDGKDVALEDSLKTSSGDYTIGRP